MRVIFTGQSGMDKKTVVENLAKSIYQETRADSKEQQQNILSSYDFEKFIATDPSSFSKYLGLPELVQLEIWEKGFNTLLRQLRDKEAPNTFLSLHSTLYRNSKYFSPLNWNLIRDFNPDLFIILIDDVYDIWWRLRERQRNYSPSGLLRLKDVMKWRSIEIMMTAQLARNLFPRKPIPYYIIATKQPVITIKRMLLDPGAMRIYAAYPITHTRDFAEKRKEIDNHRLNLHNEYVVFDPICIDEKLLHKCYNTWKTRKPQTRDLEIKQELRWPELSKEMNLPLLCEGIQYGKIIENVDPVQVSEIIESEIDQHIAWRDYRLIDQAQCLAAYRPTFEGTLSGGMSAELSYASRSLQVGVYIYIPKEDGHSEPFQSILGEVAQTYDKFLQLLAQEQKQVRDYKISPSHNSTFEIPV